MSRRAGFFALLLALVVTGACRGATAPSPAPTPSGETAVAVTTSTATPLPAAAARRAQPQGTDCPADHPVKATADRQAFAPDAPGYGDAFPTLCYTGMDPAAQDGYLAAVRPAPTRTATARAIPTQGAPVSAAAPGLTPPPQPSGAAAALTVTLSLSVTTCGAGPVTAHVIVTDANKQPVAGAAVSGEVVLKTTTHTLTFPPTDASGRTSAGDRLPASPTGFYVEWIVQAQAGPFSGAGSAFCPVP